MKIFFAATLSILMISDNLKGQEPIDVINYLKPILNNETNAAGDLWEASGFGGDLFRLRIDGPRGENGLVFLTTSIHFINFVGAWKVYKVKESGKLAPYDNEIIFSADQFYIKKSNKSFSLIWVGAPDNFDQRLLPPEEKRRPLLENQFHFPRVEEKVMLVTDSEVSARLEDSHVRMNDVKVECILIAEYLSNPKKPWKSLDFRKGIMNDHGFFISDEDMKRIESLSSFTPQKALRSLESLERLTK